MGSGEKMGTHTPGPWEAVNDRGWVVRCPNGDTVARVAAWSAAVDEADARLIAAAPDLLSEHREWSRAFGEALILARQGDYSAVDALARDFRLDYRDGAPCIKSAAIARATGETTP